MNRINHRPFKPFISLMLIVSTLLGVVFLQMEERRMGYSLLKLRREHKAILDEKRGQEIQLAKITRPQLLEHMAQRKFTLRKISSNQIIHLSGQGLTGQGMKTVMRSENRP